jgi:hypothetical protein
VATTRTHAGVPWDRRTAHERWVEDDLRLDLHRGYSATSLKTVAVKPWAERGISAAVYDIIGAESLAGMYVGKIAPGQSSNPARQLCDEAIFVGPRQHQRRDRAGADLVRMGAAQLKRDR